MFVASRVYNYATGANAVAPDKEPTPANTRVKRHPRRQAGNAASPSYAAVAATAKSHDESDRQSGGGGGGGGDDVKASEDEKARRSTAELAKIAAIDEIVQKDDLYEVLGVKRTAKTEEIRRGFLNRSRMCHPDKLPNYAPCVVAFQKVSFAYQTLSKPSSRRMYDVSGRSDLAAALNEQSGGHANGGAYDASGGMASDETLNGVLYSVFCEFLEGDFEMIRVLVNALNEGNPGLNLGDDAVDSIEGAFRRLRELMMAGKKYLTIIRFELIRLYEIQHSLRQLSYFDVFGRLRLTLQLARVTLSIPMAIDQAMKEPESSPDVNEANESRRDEKGSVGGNDTSEDGESASDDDDDDDDDDKGEQDDEGEDDDDDDDSMTATEGTAAKGAERRRKGKRRRNRRRRKPSADDFGMRAEEDGQEDKLGFEAAADEPTGLFGGSTSNTNGRTHARHAARSAQRRARIEERRRAKLEAKEAQSVQRSGLLGPTASGLLKGVVRVLETSESWVPGGGGKEAPA